MRDYRRAIAIILCATLIFQLASCGTIIYPERKGQGKGKVDPTVAILDSVGVLLFIIPGLIAFAVDFHTGAIYMPHGHSAESGALEGTDALLEGIRLKPDERNLNGVERRVSEAIGQAVRLRASNVQTYQFASADSALEELARTSCASGSTFKTANALP